MSKLALYLRLSVDEYGKDESNSIINQRYLLNHFLDSTPEFKRFQREEFVDDGFSGTSLKRPAFQRLIADVKAGQIKCILGEPPLPTHTLRGRGFLGRVQTY